VVVLVVRFSIYLWVSTDSVFSTGNGTNSCEEPGVLYTASTTERPFICERILCTFSVCGGSMRILVIACIQLAVHVSCSFQVCLSLDLGFDGRDSGVI